MGAIRRENPHSTHITTTLYDLIEAISDEVQPGEESLLADVVLHLLDSGKIKCNGNLKISLALLESDGVQSEAVV